MSIYGTQKKQRVVGSSLKAKAINDHINAVLVRVHNIHTDLLTKGEIINAESIKNAYLGLTEKQQTLFGAFKYFLAQNTSKLKKSTQNKYNYCKDHLENFLWKKSKKSDMMLSQFNLLFINEFKNYLQEKCEFKNASGLLIKKKANEHNSTLKYLTMLKSIISYSKALGLDTT